MIEHARSLDLRRLPRRLFLKREESILQEITVATGYTTPPSFFGFEIRTVPTNITLFTEELPLDLTVNRAAHGNGFDNILYRYGDVRYGLYGQEFAQIGIKEIRQGTKKNTTLPIFPSSSSNFTTNVPAEGFYFRFDLSNQLYSRLNSKHRVTGNVNGDPVDLEFSSNELGYSNTLLANNPGWEIGTVGTGNYYGMLSYVIQSGGAVLRFAFLDIGIAPMLDVFIGGNVFSTWVSSNHDAEHQAITTQNPITYSTRLWTRITHPLINYDLQVEGKATLKTIAFPTQTYLNDGYAIKHPTTTGAYGPPVTNVVEKYFPDKVLDYWNPELEVDGYKFTIDTDKTVW